MMRQITGNETPSAYSHPSMALQATTATQNQEEDPQIAVMDPNATREATHGAGRVTSRLHAKSKAHDTRQPF